jgi:DMSO reductase anchor subunit
MHPAFSVIFLTTLIGVGQGLVLALVTAQSYAAVGFIELDNPSSFFGIGSLIALLFLAAGLLASFFHLGRPERAWRSIARWRTSWLSREVIVLPMFMGMVFVYGVLHYFGWDPNVLGVSKPLQGQLSLLVGLAGTVICFALFVCTGMIYACIKFLQEWHSPLTVINLTLLGMASGFTLATAYAALQAPHLTTLYAVWAIIITLAALVTRVWSLLRNRRIRYKSSLRTAIGVTHSKIVQKSQGFMAGSFNTREFFHGAPQQVYQATQWTFLVLVFPVPLLLLAAGMSASAVAILGAAFLVQYGGLLAERWFFFAQANHPQNLYYQTVG